MSVDIREWIALGLRMSVSDCQVFVPLMMYHYWDNKNELVQRYAKEVLLKKGLLGRTVVAEKGFFDDSRWKEFGEISLGLSAGEPWQPDALVLADAIFPRARSGPVNTGLERILVLIPKASQCVIKALVDFLTSDESCAEEKLKGMRKFQKRLKDKEGYNEMILGAFLEETNAFRMRGDLAGSSLYQDEWAMIRGFKAHQDVFLLTNGLLKLKLMKEKSQAHLAQ